MSKENTPRPVGRPQKGYYKRNADTGVLQRSFPFEGKYMVYGLASRETHETIEYVGFTKRPLNHRYNDHISKSKGYKYPKDKWIKDLLDGEGQLVMVVLEEGISTFDDACEREKHHIHELNQVHPLKNVTKGGVGSPGRVASEETRKKTSETLKATLRAKASRRNRRERAGERALQQSSPEQE